MAMFYLYLFFSCTITLNSQGLGHFLPYVVCVEYFTFLLAYIVGFNPFSAQETELLLQAQSQGVFIQEQPV